MYLSYVGLRVQDPKRSEAFYQEVFGLEPIDTMDWSTWKPTEPACILLKDPKSGQRLELNYYPPGSPYAVPYRPGEELDHIAFRVDDLRAMLVMLEARGIPYEPMPHYSGPYSEGTRLLMAYVRDPDGIQLELFQSTQGEPVAYRSDSY
jgi:catechol 2,3-dioxygenase-like lactoylglutathione lyase family enzyme